MYLKYFSIMLCCVMTCLNATETEPTPKEQPKEATPAAASSAARVIGAKVVAASSEQPTEQTTELYYYDFPGSTSPVHSPLEITRLDIFGHKAISSPTRPWFPCG